MSNFAENDVNRMSWEEFSKLMESLISEVSNHFQKNNQRIDVIAPMLRTGGIVGGMLAIKMKVETMLPVQFKYSYNPTTINQITTLPDILPKISESPNILLCEGNTSSGSIATKAAKAIKEKYPNSKIYLATITKVYEGPESLEGIDGIFYGQMTNESFKATPEQESSLNLRKGITIFPWETAEDELADINAN